MSRYIPGAVPNEGPGFRRWIADELRRVANAINDRDALELTPRGTAPPRPRLGMMACADGVLWDPGSGAGIYEYRGGTWQKL